MIQTVDFLELFRRDMGVNLSRGDVNMPEHHLHGAQVCAPFE
jgi:hypothetical protein